MKKKTSIIIKELLEKNGTLSAKDLSEYLGISPRATFKQLRNLLEKKEISKVGKPPKVFYHLPKAKVAIAEFVLNRELESLINENFLYITSTGNELEGLRGFEKWCTNRNLKIEKTAKEYQKTFNKYKKFKRAGLINGLEKMKATFKKVYLNKIYYLDFYSIERFGKTKLGQYLLYAKQSQNRKLIKVLTDIIKPKIKVILNKYNIHAIAFVPPTVKREIQFMKVFEHYLSLNLPKVSIVKVKSDIMIPQKTLNKLQDRIENAKLTIIVDEKKSFKRVLLIDDAIGSGSTLNETANQLKSKKIAKEVIGLAITGSFKGFDVISEV
ncbi:hypothetical protein ACFL21_00235 [Patescibacteria group bacterium]